MNMALADWAIVAVLLSIMVFSILISRGYMRGVADFLAAGRSAGRYVLSLSQGMSALGAITIVGLFEMNYAAGFSMSWWGLTMGVVILAITVSGWVIYRFRRTRCLTLAEFFERRYGKSFRVFAGLLCFLGGIVNFGIFPAVEARFFLYFCGFPQTIAVLGIAVPVFPLLMAFLIATALFFVFAAGQVGVIVTDFLQGLFVNVVFVVVAMFLVFKVDWTRIVEALSTAPENASLLNPYKTSAVKDFNFFYFLIGVVGVIYNTMSWQGTQAYNASARNAHEARMGGVLGNWRGIPQGLFLLFVPVAAYAVMHHPDFAGIRASVEGTLAGAGTEAVQNQLRTPLVLARILPAGLIGAFAAVMLAASVTTLNSYMHSWGSILVQDVVRPVLKRDLSPKAHLRLLKLAILGVAVFAFLFSLLFTQTQYIFMFFAITGAIFVGGSGAVIIGGLYTRFGTAAAAWAAMITGSAIAVAGIVILQVDPEFPVNGQEFWAIAMGGSVLVYVGLSLLRRGRKYDLDALLHRGEHDAAGETKTVEERPARGLRMLGMGREFTRGDRIIYFATYAWTASWTLIFVVGTVLNLGHPAKDSAWASYWKFYFWSQVLFSGVVILWFTTGGLRDLRAMFRRLDTMERDAKDDGVVREGGSR